MKGDKRTPGERSRDLTISVMAKKCECILLQLKRMEDSAAFNRDYKNAQNYEKLTRLITDVCKTPLKEED